MAECQLPKLNVAGSIPVSRSTHPRRAMRLIAIMVAAIVVAAGASVVIGFPIAVLAIGLIVAMVIVWHFICVSRRFRDRVMRPSDRPSDGRPARA